MPTPIHVHNKHNNVILFLNKADQFNKTKALISKMQRRFVSFHTSAISHVARKASSLSFSDSLLLNYESFLHSRAVQRRLHFCIFVSKLTQLRPSEGLGGEFTFSPMYSPRMRRGS